MGFSTRPPPPRKLFSWRRLFSLSVAFRLLLLVIFPAFETAYLVPDDLRGVLPESSDEEEEEDVPAVPPPYSSADGDDGWSGTGGRNDPDESAVLTEVAYRLMTRRLSYTPKVKRNPSIMALDNIDFAITALDSNRNHQRRTKAAIDQLMSSTGGQTGTHHDAASPHRAHWPRPNGLASLLPSSAGSPLPPSSSSPRRDRLVLNVSANDIRKLINMIEKGKRGSRKSKMTSSSSSSASAASAD